MPELSDALEEREPESEAGRGQSAAQDKDEAAPASKLRWKVVIRAGRNIGYEVPLRKDEMLIGRRSANEIQVLDPKSSRQHAKILQEEGRWAVRDLGSRNGTYLNGAPLVGQRALNVGDQLKIGDTVLEVVDEAAEGLGTEVEIPGYKVLEKIGQGGMGVVYKALHLAMDRVVALKVLHERQARNPEFIDRFIREARAAGRLNHPNVINVHTVDQAKNKYYLSMEYIDGSSVKTILRRQKLIPVDKALDIALQTARALEFAHENDIVHRDIKPDNLMLTKDGVVKLSDLGIAKTYDEAVAADTSGRKKVYGTPHYMAPEQALGKPIDKRVDIYSLGATFYHMITGETPFQGKTPKDVIAAHIHDKLPAIQDLNPEAPDAVCFVIERMMAKNPEKRYPNMSRLIEDLEKAQKGVTAGIERIPAGDSQIMRAVGKKPARRRRKESEEERKTGKFSPLGHPAVLGTLAVIVILALVAALVLSGRTSPSGAVTPDQSDGSAATARESPGEADAKKLLTQARELLRHDPASPEAFARLTQLANDYPATASASVVAAMKQQIKEKQAQKRFEELLGRRPGEAEANLLPELDKIAQEFPDTTYGQKAKAEAERLRAEQQQAAEDRGRKALEQARRESGLGLDFIARRRPFEDFAQANPGTTWAAEAQKEIAKINQERDEYFQSVKTRSAEAEKARHYEAALHFWQQALQAVSDDTFKTNAEKELAALKSRLEKAYSEVAKVADQKLKNYTFAEALRDYDELEREFRGLAELRAQVNARLGEIKAQRQLHERVVEKIDEATGAGAHRTLPFEMTFPKLQSKRFKVASATAEKLELRADPPAAEIERGITLSRKWAELSPAEVYTVYKIYLDENQLGPQEHRQLAIFCAERGLAEQQKLHEQKASEK